MKVLVATERGQGQRANDFCNVPEGELLFGGGFECDGEKVDGSCGCRRSFVGFNCCTATTTAVIEERSISLQELRWQAAISLGTSWGTITSVEMLDDEIKNIAIADSFKVGDVIEKRGSYYRLRDV